MIATDNSRFRRTELVLRQLEALPTLEPIADRLLTLAAGEGGQLPALVRLIAADPALTGRVLALYYSNDFSDYSQLLSVEQIANRLGADSLRSIALAARAVDPNASPAGDEGQGLDRPRWWRHSLATALAARRLAQLHDGAPTLAPEAAYLGGLLHDIGKLALDVLLPKAYGRALQSARQTQGRLAECERQVLGLDHHTAGKRLAEAWRLPHCLQDCIWLHGSSYDALPTLEHQRLIGLVALANHLSHRLDDGFSPDGNGHDPVEQLTRRIGFNPEHVAAVQQELPQLLAQVETQLNPAAALPAGQLQQSMVRANETLARLNLDLQRQSQAAAAQVRVLDGIAAFHAGARPGRSVQDIASAVAGSAWSVLGPGFYCLVYQPQQAGTRMWMVCQYGAEGQPVHSELIEPPPHTPDLTRLDPQGPAALNYMGLLPWLADYLLDAPDMRTIRLLPLSCGWGTSALLLHDRPNLPPWSQLGALSYTWGAALAAASQHEGARRLGEELAEANSALAQAQDRLLQTESLARLGEMAAGAAHEMNNPLAVISGRSQLLVQQLEVNSSEAKAARIIAEQAHKLSDLITLLRYFADPPQPRMRLADLAQVLRDAVSDVQGGLSNGQANCTIALDVADNLPSVAHDPQQMRQAVVELLRNAVEAQPATGVRVSVAVEAARNLVQIQVSDDGCGMDAHTLAHALDPFFSAKPAGRQVGMGLARAAQVLGNHQGRISLRSQPGQGTVAHLTFPLDLAVVSADR